MSQDDAFVNNLLPSASRLSAPPTALLTAMSLTTTSSIDRLHHDKDIDSRSVEEPAIQASKHSKSKGHRSYRTASLKRKNKYKTKALLKAANTEGVGS